MQKAGVRAWMLAGAAGAAIGLLTPESRGQTTANWLAPVTDVWTSNARWSTGQFPNNNGPNTFIANLSVTGASYMVTLDQGITLTGLNIDTSDATLELANFDMTVESSLTLANSAVLGLGGTGRVISNGVADLSGAMLYQVTEFISNGPLNFHDGLLANDICDTDIRHRGAVGAWDGTQDINFTDGSSFIIEPGASFELQSAARLLRVDTGGAAPIFRNEGTLIKDSAGESFFEGGVLQNTGTLDVRAGTFRSDTFEITGGTLAAGVYSVSGGADLQLDGVTVLINQASVILDGAGASFGAFDSVQTNDPAGSIAVRNGRDFTTTGEFRNDGTVEVADATVFRVAPGFSLLNITAGTLDGGTYALAGALRADNLAGLQAVNADVTLDGPGSALADGAGADVTPGVRSVGPLGALTFTGGRDNTTTGDFTVDAGGVLTVDAGSEFVVGPGFELTNFANGDFAFGTFIVRGIVRADNLAVGTIGDTDITLGDQGAFLDGNGVDAFSSLQTINAGGSLTLAEGRSLALNAGNSLDVTGNGATLTVGTGGPDQSTLVIPQDLSTGAGSTLSLGDGRIEVGGTVTLNGALRGSGVLAGDVVTNGSIGPGNSPGLLSIEGDLRVAPDARLVVELAGLDPERYDRVLIDGILTHDGPDEQSGLLAVRVIEGFRPAPGDEFTILTFASRTGDFARFEGLTYGSGRFLVIANPGDLRLVYVPAPAWSGLALATPLLLVRRRRLNG